MINDRFLEYFPLVFGGLLASVFAFVFYRLIVPSTPPAPPEDDGIWRPRVRNAASRVVRHTTERRVQIDGYTVSTGTAYYGAPDRPEGSAPFVAVINPPDAPPFKLASPPTTDIERALHAHAPEHLEVKDALLRLQLHPNARWRPTAQHLIRIAHGLIHGEAWVDWLADPRDDDRLERHLLLLSALPERPQARALAPQYLRALEPELRAWAALCHDTQAALDRALHDKGIPAELYRRLFSARLQHGLVGFDATVAASLRSDDQALVRLAINSTHALPLETARTMLTDTFPFLLNAARPSVLEALALRDPAAAAHLAFDAFGTEDATLARVAMGLVVAGLSPAEATAGAIPLLTGGPLTAENACDVLSKVGTLDAVMPLRALAERTQFTHDLVAFSANAAVEDIQARANGQLGGLAISAGRGGALSLSTEADQRKV